MMKTLLFIFLSISFLHASYEIIESENLFIVKTNNTESFLTEKDIDGVLVGGASIDPNSFFDIVKKAVKS